MVILLAFLPPIPSIMLDEIGVRSLFTTFTREDCFTAKRSNGGHRRFQAKQQNRFSHNFHLSPKYPNL